MNPISLNTASPDFKSAPIHEVRRLQSYGDVVPVRYSIPFFGQTFPRYKTLFATTRAENTEFVLTRNDLFVSELRNAGQPGARLVPNWMPRSIKDLGESMLHRDQPDHRRLRGLVDQAFAKRSVLELTPMFDELATQLVDQLTIDLRERGASEFVRSVSRRMAIDAIVSMFGLPTDDMQKFTGWAEKLADMGEGWWQIGLALRASSQMREYVLNLIETERFGDPRGVVAALTEAEETGDKLSRDELVTTLFLLILAGFETTTHLMNGGIWVLGSRPDIREILRREPDKMDLFLSECLRWLGPVVSTKPRFSAIDQKLAGREIKRGEPVLPMVICANYDDRLFETPEKFDLNRSNAKRQMSFGRGIHNCLGRQIALAEASSLFSALLATPEPFFAVSEPVWAKGYRGRTMKSLRITTS